MYQRQLEFGEAVKRALTVNYCNFEGRASRSEYWWFSLFGVPVSAIISVVFCWSDTAKLIVSGIFSLACFLPSLGLAVRRLHDIGKSGWFILISLIPVVGWILIIIWLVKESDPTPNMYGPVPNMVEK